jgi:hypothetical protein
MFSLSNLLIISIIFPIGYSYLSLTLWIYAKIKSQIFSVQVLTLQGVKIKEYPAYSVFSQRRFAKCMGGENMKLFLCEPESSPDHLALPQLFMLLVQ